ncbi:MAG TPA: hypothetical protein PLB02_15590, partial [Thermoanaerobaculia bacterium]|nr:hypothetical protein [Thermoanaerobaculia bacterium]
MGALVADRERTADVIVAPATPPGASALAIVRLSGREAKSMRDFEEQALSRIQAFAGSLAVDADSQDFHHLVRTQV